MEWKILHEYDGENGNPLFCQAKCVDCTVNVFYADNEFQVETEDEKGIVEVSKLADLHFVTMEEAQTWIEKELGEKDEN